MVNRTNNIGCFQWTIQGIYNLTSYLPSTDKVYSIFKKATYYLANFVFLSINPTIYPLFFMASFAAPSITEPVINRLKALWSRHRSMIVAATVASIIISVHMTVIGTVSIVFAAELGARISRYAESLESEE